MSRRLTLIVFILALLGAGLFAAGFLAGRYGPLFASEGSLGQDITNYWKTKKLIKDKFVHQVSEEDLIVGATKGLVEGTGDPYSEFLTKEEAKILNQTLAGSVEGIGVEIGEKNGLVTVIAPLPDSPALRAGVRAGDVIVSIGGKPTAGATLDEVAQQIRGPKGTSITLELKSGNAPSRTLTLTRETVHAPSAELTYQGDVAVIELSRFGDDTKAAMDKVVADIQAHKPRGLILDMRSNPGGYLEGAVQVSSIFLKSGDVVREQFAHGKTQVERVDHDGRLAGYPLVVLVDKGTASAAEIVAGALRDDRGIKLVGVTTYGKGSVQELEELGAGALLKLTIAEWLTPKGVSISKHGLKPDVAVADANQQLATAIAQLK